MFPLLLFSEHPQLQHRIMITHFPLWPRMNKSSPTNTCLKAFFKDFPILIHFHYRKSSEYKSFSPRTSKRSCQLITSPVFQSTTLNCQAALAILKASLRLTNLLSLVRNPCCFWVVHSQYNCFLIRIHSPCLLQKIGIHLSVKTQAVLIVSLSFISQI